MDFKKIFKSKEFKYFLIFFILISLLGAGYLFFRNGFSKENVILQISAPKEASNGEEVSWVVTVKNKSNIKIKDIKLVVEYPSGIFDSKGNLKKREEFKIKEISSQEEEVKNLSGIIFGKKNEKKEIKASLIYSPLGFSSEFQNESSFVTLITDSLITLNMKLPDKAEKGEKIKMSLSWQSGFSLPLDSVQVRVTLPEGFKRTSGPEEDERGNFETQEKVSQSKIIFDIGTLNEGEGQKKEIEGKLSGEIGDEKMFKAEIGKFDEEQYEFIPLDVAEKSIKIVSSNIELSRKINGQDEYFPIPGEKLSYVVKFKNAGEDIYRDLDLAIELNSDYLDLSTLKSQGGEVESNKITYSSKTVPELLYLGPYEEGSVGFSVSVKSGVLPQDSSVRDTITVGKIVKSYVTKISSQSSFYQYAYYHLPKALKGQIKTGGSFPLKENKETTLVIYWKPKNKGNRIENSKITAILPSNVKWTGKFYPANSNFSYNKSKRVVTLNLGDISYNFSKSYAFQLKVKSPDLPQDLISNSKFFGRDNWTRQSFEVLAPNLSTESVD